MSWSEPRECDLCGATDRVTVRLVHWKVSLPGMSYAQVPRCVDDVGCKRRVLESGKPWPLVETERAA